MDTGMFSIGEQAYLRMLNNIICSDTTTQYGRGSHAFKIGAPSMITHYFNKVEDKYTFPLLTTKFVKLQNIAIELEFFLKGETNNQWLEERGCNIWSKWADKDGNLGPIYGVQWNKKNKNGSTQIESALQGVMRFVNDKYWMSKRLLVDAWNVEELDKMALPPCHFAFQLIPYSDGGKAKRLSLVWFQRSADVCVGVPYNLASYALLLLIFCKITGCEPGYVTGMFSIPHVYIDQIKMAKEQIIREILDPPLFSIPKELGDDIKCWDYKNISLKEYKHHKSLNYPVSI